MNAIARVLAAVLVASQATALLVPYPRAEAGVLAGAPVSNISVYVDTLAQCGWATISWSGAVPPVTFMIGLGGFYVGTTTLETHDDLNDDAYGWTVTEPSGSDLIFMVTDAGGAVGYIQNQQVTDGEDWCLSSASASASPTTSSDVAATSNASASYTAYSLVSSSSSSLKSKASSKSSASSAGTSSVASSSTSNTTSIPDTYNSTTCGSSHDTNSTNSTDSTDTSAVNASSVVSVTVAASNASSTLPSTIEATLAAATQGTSDASHRLSAGSFMLVCAVVAGFAVW